MNDPHRPAYHFLPPAAWMNDINGALYWKGRHHIFYQFNPEGAYWKCIQWGHASSIDLVHWVVHPVALTPDPDGPDHVCSHMIATQYHIGRVEDERFIPETHGRMSWLGGQLGGPRSMDADGRRLFFDWVREIRGSERERASGWSGVTTVLRTLSLDEHHQLRIEPVEELASLRMPLRTHADIEVDDEVDLEGIKGACLELSMQIDPGTASEFGVKVFCAPDGVEQTAISCDMKAGMLRVDVGWSTLDPEIVYARYRRLYGRQDLLESELYTTVQEAPFELANGGPLVLRVFLDGSILEAFANGRQCITQRVYPTRADSVGVRLFCRGGSASFTNIQAWQLAPAHP